MEEIKYINVADYQGGSWYIGVVETIKGWKEIALSWCETDNSEELYEYIEKQKENEDLLNFINEVWTINIVKYDSKNKDHEDLVRSRLYE